MHQYPVSVAMYCGSEFYEQELCHNMQDAFQFCNAANEAFNKFEIYHNDAPGCYAMGIRRNGVIFWIHVDD